MRDNGREMADAFVRVTCLPVGHGDSILVEYGKGSETHRVLVDGGPANHYDELREALAQYDRRYDLLIVSHIDADHIDGALILLRDEALGLEFADVWFNGWPQLAALSDNPEEDAFGPHQGEFVGAVLHERGLPWNEAFSDPEGNEAGIVAVPKDGPLPVHDLPGKAQITLLSPGGQQLRRLRRSWSRVLVNAGMKPGDWEAAKNRLERREVYKPPVPLEDVFAPKTFGSDTAVANGSSIACSFEYEGLRVLLAADAHPRVLADGLGRLAASLDVPRVPFHAVKVPHHGSMANIDEAVLNAIDARTFLISTDGSYFDHPDPPTIRKLGERVPGAEVRFNYLSSTTSPWEQLSAQRDDGIGAVFPPEGGSILLPE